MQLVKIILGSSQGYAFLMLGIHQYVLLAGDISGLREVSS